MLFGVLAVVLSGILNARDMPWIDGDFDWSKADLPAGLVVGDVKKLRERVGERHSAIFKALKDDDVDAFVKCWFSKVEREDYVRALAKARKVEISEEDLVKYLAAQEALDVKRRERHANYFSKLRRYLLSKFESMENVELVEVNMDDMASGVFTNKDKTMRVDVPIFFRAKVGARNVVAVELNHGSYLAELDMFSLGGIGQIIYLCDKGVRRHSKGQSIWFKDLE